MYKKYLIDAFEQPWAYLLVRRTAQSTMIFPISFSVNSR
jgi:hypothetical protein